MLGWVIGEGILVQIFMNIARPKCRFVQENIRPLSVEKKLVQGHSNVSNDLPQQGG
jgi:hypothetical protein